MKTWMDNHPTVEDAVYGWELLNEPATYQRAVALAPAADRDAMRSEMVELYVNHMVELAAIVSEGSDARILVEAWGYGGDTATLSQTFISGLSAVDALRSALGNDLVWSLHFYPGWMGTGNMTDPAAIQAVWANFMAPLAGDDILMTEINASGVTTFNPFQPDQVTTATALSLDWLKAAGVGIGWFPAVQTGSSGLAMIERDGDIRYLNQPSLAAALNAFSIGTDSSAHDQAEFIRPTLNEAVLRNQVKDPDFVLGRLDPVSFAGIGFGYGGNDTIVGSAVANNFLYGGAGDDFIGGSDHDDFLFGQDGNDFIVSGEGIDHLFGGKGDDTLIGNYLNNTAYGGDGADLFVVDTGANLVVVDYSAADHDTWMGSRTGRYLGHTILDANGDDRLDLRVHFSDGGEILFLGAGGTLDLVSVLSGLRPFDAMLTRVGDRLIALSRVDGDSADAALIGPLANLTMGEVATPSPVGTQFADSLIGGAANDTINAGDGSDIVYGGAGADRIDGGTGNDLIFGDADADFLSGGTGNDTIFGGSGNDTISGGGDINLLSGGEGNDSIDGGSGSDSISGGEGDDTVFGGNGSDIIFGDAGADVIVGGAGNDSLYGGIGNDSLTGGVGNDLIDGGAGTDRVYFTGAAAAAVNLNLTTAQVTGYGSDTLLGIEHVTSGDGNDRLTGNAFANSLIAGRGNDTLYGGAGNDTLGGGAGNDALYGGAGNDLIDGGAGTDRVYFIAATAAVVNLNLITAQVTGHGRDTLRGIEHVTSGSGNDRLTGNALANSLIAGRGNDTLYGGAGNDLINGGAGNDLINGGRGADTFVFNTALGAGNIDWITDFSVVDDTIRLENAIFTGLANGVLSAGAFVANATGLAADALDRIIYETDTGFLFFDADGTGAGARVQFATLTANIALTNADFVVF
ncbi:MAG: calcium-binding protein [Paracoccaceae bacterium]|nr:calcium-binding protein [Paracoccaceae bacterium]